LRPSGHFSGNTGHGVRGSYDLVLANGLHRRVPFHDEAIQPRNATGWVTVGGFPANRNVQIEVLAPHKLPITDGLAAARHDAADNGKTGNGLAEFRRGESEQRLIRIGSHFANVEGAPEEPRGGTAVRCPVGVAKDESNRFRPDIQFFGDHLGVVCAHAGSGLGAACAHQNCAVVADLKPGGEPGGVERRGVERRGVERCRAFRGIVRRQSAWDAERDKERAACPHESAPGDKG
jgi:hypothetical protein